MKARNLLTILSVAALTTVNVMAADVLLTPHASAAQTRIAATSTVDPNLAAPGLMSASPRILDSKVKTVAGKSDTVTPSMQCTRHMAGTPKSIGACADHPGAPMSCCSVAEKK